MQEQLPSGLCPGWTVCRKCRSNFQSTQRFEIIQAGTKRYVKFRRLFNPESLSYSPIEWRAVLEGNRITLKLQPVTQIRKS